MFQAIINGFDRHGKDGIAKHQDFDTMGGKKGAIVSDIVRGAQDGKRQGGDLVNRLKLRSVLQTYQPYDLSPSLRISLYPVQSLIQRTIRQGSGAGDDDGCAIGARRHSRFELPDLLRFRYQAR